jgi:uncharacterized protein YidB (DUF937 family)
MSGFLGALLGGSNQGGPGQSTAIANVLQQVLSQNGGGIATLISRFTDAHVDRVFTQDEIANWASQAGTDPDKMRAVLAEALPHAVDHVTPNGEIPSPTATPDLSSLIRRFMGGAAAILIVRAISRLVCESNLV